MKKMVTANKFRRFRGVWLNVIRRFQNYCIWEKLFCLSTAGFVAFGVLAYALGCLAGHGPFVGSTPFFGTYLLDLTLSLGVGGLIYYLVAYLSKRNRFFKILAGIFLTVMLIMESCGLLLCTVYYDTILTDDEIGLSYSDWSYEDTHHRHMIFSSKLIGQGPDTPASPYYDMLSDREIFPLLPLVSYVYGYWILILFSVLSVVWIISAVRVYLKLYRRWHEWLFLIPFLIAAHFLITSILGFLGLIPCVQVCPFTGNWVLMCILPVPILSIMCAVLKLNHDAV